MTIPEPTSLMHRLSYHAEIIWRVARHDPRQCQAAIAWTLRNRGLGAYRHGAGGHPILPDPRRGLAAEARDYCRLIALCSAVWAEDIADPSGGATRFHRHDRAPRWAELATPVALIGRFCFYRPALRSD